MSNIIGVCGSGSLQKEYDNVFEIAENIGKHIAKQKGIVLCGGKGGVMEAVCKGAKQEGGTTIGILPYESDEANLYVDIPISTGLGEKRNAVIIQTADCIIALSGKWGTLNEITLAMLYQKPIIFLNKTGGFVDIFIESGFIDHITSPYHITDSEEEAVMKAMQFCQDNQTKN